MDKLKVAHARLRKLRELDASTKVPFIMVELRGEGDRNGHVEICGKDEYGVYHALDEWLTSHWGCKMLDGGDLNDDMPVPFCDALYRWEGYRAVGANGMSNMGLCSMHLVDFMTNQLSWTLGVINGGNVGKEGEIREQQIIFKAPHPMNLVSPHVLIELRSAGFVEVCGAHAGVLDDLDPFFKEFFKAEITKGHEEFCDRYYTCAEGVFKTKGRQGENNMGLLTTKVCDFVGELPGWNLVTMNGGNYGEEGVFREQQLVFRRDDHPLQAHPHLLLELRGSGYIEVNGQDAEGIYSKLDTWLKKTWRCAETEKGLCDRKYKWQQRDMMSSTAQVIEFFHSLGWCMQVCSQGTVEVAGSADSREQQILLRPGMSSVGHVEPHLLIELYAGEGTEALYLKPERTQVLGEQHVRMCPIGDCSKAVEEFHNFMINYMGGTPDESTYLVDCFLSRGYVDNNLGCWTMRVCDFMVDTLGWSFVSCNVCNLGGHGHIREQQLIFRYDGERRHIPVATNPFNNITPADFQGMVLPPYWQIPEVVGLKKNQVIIVCDQDESNALQEIMDNTFKRILTRDRVYEYHLGVNEEMPYRLELVHAFRSENLSLQKAFEERRSRYTGGTPLVAKTREGGRHVNARLKEGENLLFHGTNPSSSISILKTGFVLNHAGKATGTMFGYGIYLAECSSKSDEYARVDAGGNYPGLFALLVCRSLVGNPYVAHKPGEYVVEATQNGCDCILGDREASVNTYREFVFFDESKVVPEYTIIYKRQYDKEKVPPKLIHLHTKATGTTGRAWQVKLDKGWANIPPETNRELLGAQRSGRPSVMITMGTIEYEFNLKARTQTNKSTAMVRQLRPPMIPPT